MSPTPCKLIKYLQRLQGVLTMGHLVMSDKERLRKALMEMVSQKKITLNQAAIQCQISYRQAKRLYRRYKLEGDTGIVHHSRGQKSNRSHPHREKILTLYKEKYPDFGPTLAAEKLSEDDNLTVDHDTLRAWLLEENLWQRQRKRNPYRQQRECRAQFGELVQIDGSIHDWLEDGKDRCLLNMVDDATTKTLSHLENGETTRNIFLTVWRWIELYGIPLAFYVDLKNVYVSKKDMSHFARACKKLGIRIIKAHSPQAKGRVERNHAVYQDRFVKELRLKKVKTIEGANAVLEAGFIDKLNQKFEKQPRNSQSAHRPLNEIDLNQIFCWEYKRTVQNDWTFSFINKIHQIKKSYGNTVKPRVKIEIRKHLDGSISAWHQGNRLSIVEIEKRPKLIEIKPKIKSVITMSQRGRISREVSSWNQSNSELFSPIEMFVSNTHKHSRSLKIAAKSNQ